MITIIPDNVKEDICARVSNNFSVAIDESIINYIQEFQSKIAIEEGFAKLKTVRFYKLCVFQYNPKKADSKNTMKRLMVKHGNDFNKADIEFKTIGKIMNIAETDKKLEERNNRKPLIRRCHKFTSIDGKFTVR